MTSPVDRALAKARVRPRPYTAEEMDTARIRLAGRLADRMWQGCLSFDDQMRQARTTAGLPRQAHQADQAEDKLPYAQRLRNEAASDLRTLCQTVVSQDDALHHLQVFLARPILEPEGALVLGCVLQLAAREDSARFWWQFAAGAGDTAAAYCLSLHHRALGELCEARLWLRQADPHYQPPLPTAFVDREDLLAVVRLLSALRFEAREAVDLTPATTAVIDYVPDALGYVEDVDLPLPAPDFAERIEELTTI